MFKYLSRHRYFPRIFWLAVITLVLLMVFIFVKNAYSKFNIIDSHEHIENMQKAEQLKLAMSALGISKTILLPSPIETITLNGHKSFTRYKENMDEILKIAKKYPASFIPLCTISPLDKDALQTLKDCHEKGGKGLKLYNGHSLYYGIFGMPLDSPVMDPIYAYSEEVKLPVLFHVNLTQYGSELENVLKKYPNLAVSIPHFMVSSVDLTKAEHILDTYPNTYTDISFGFEPYFAAGFRRISAEPQKYVDFFTKYSDRILFGADMVLTQIEKKDRKYMETTLKCYKDILEKKSFTCAPVNGYYKGEAEKDLKAYGSCKNKDSDYCKTRKQQMESFTRWYNETKRLKGLNLGSDILRKIYEENPERFLSGNNL